MLEWVSNKTQMSIMMRFGANLEEAQIGQRLIKHSVKYFQKYILLSQMMR
jgi:hypothetical protein